MKRAHREWNAKRGDSDRLISRAVIRMPHGAPRLVGQDGTEEEPRTEAERQLQALLHNQLDTTKAGFQNRKKEFITGTVYQRIEASGTHSLDQFNKLQEDQEHLDELRSIGLSDYEIKLKLAEDNPWDEGEQERKREGYGAHEHARIQRKKAITELFEKKEARLSRSLDPQGVAGMSRHAMELEQSLGEGDSEKKGIDLKHLVQRKTQETNWNFPKEIMPSHTVYQTEVMLSRRKGDRSGEAANEKAEDEEGQEEVDLSKPPKLAVIDQLPEEVICRHKLKLEEIRALPRFRDYKLGDPGRVLFVKNLHQKVTEDDLFALFGRFHGNGGSPIKIRVMKGRMNGQAFVEFENIDLAISAVELVNGYVMRDRPVILQYGRRRDM